MDENVNESMIYNIMTWNTQLFEQGNKLFSKGKSIKAIDKDRYDKIFIAIAKHLESSRSIAVLQEIPYVSNVGWKEHKIFTAFKDEFSEKDYDVFYNIYSKKQLKMTVVIAKKEITEKEVDKINTGNCFVGCTLKETGLRILAIHSHKAKELDEWLAKEKNYYPQMILGDFNAGNYKKKNKDFGIAENRKNYLMVCEGYIDLFQGFYTTRYKTHIDHVLIENSNEFHDKYSIKDIVVGYDKNLSDHYPLSFKLEYNENCNDKQ